jgi:hypothetical protein
MENLYHKEKNLIKLKRALPKSPDMCKLSTYANALNYYGYKKRYGEMLTPEKLLAKINYNRKKEGLKKLDPVKDVIPTKDLDFVVKKLKLMKIRYVAGNYLAKPETWTKILESGELIAPYHQMVYGDLPLMKTDFVKQLGNSNRFAYNKFYKFVEKMIAFYGPFDNGHIDLVLDIKKHRGKLKVVLANLVSVDNKHPIAIDWNLFTRYLFWDWIAYKKINSPKQIPTKNSLKRLSETGKVKYKSFEFMWGSALIFSPVKVA